MAEGFLESIGISELLPQEYQRGYTDGRNSMSGEYSRGYNAGYSAGFSAGKNSATSPLFLEASAGSSELTNAGEWGIQTGTISKSSISVRIGRIEWYIPHYYGTNRSNTFTWNTQSFTLSRGNSWSFPIGNLDVSHCTLKVSLTGSTLRAWFDVTMSIQAIFKYFLVAY